MSHELDRRHYADLYGPTAGDVMAGGKPVPSWGLHLIDVHAAMGNLVDIVGKQAKAFKK